MSMPLLITHTKEYRRAVVQSVDAERLLRERYGINKISHRGDELTTSCPLPFGNHKHGDKSPSFSVNKESRVCNCYVCGGGSLAWLVQSMEGISYEEAIKVLEQFRDEMSDEDFSSLVQSFGTDTSTAEEVRIKNCDYQIENWSKNRHDYWQGRGITRQTEAHWRLGYSPEENRIVVPHRFNGEWVGYQMRTLDGKGPKWKNSTDFPKATTLFNYDGVRQCDTIIIVEAALSAIWLWQLGYKNVVATFGASVTEEQCRLLRFADNAVVWFDPDKAGAHGLDLLTSDLANHMNVYVPRGIQSDPNDTNEADVHKILQEDNLMLVF